MNDLLDHLKALSNARPPDQIIGEPDDPYLLRWWLVPRNGTANVYLHKFCRSDDDRALHDHPWDNMSVLLEGQYLEVTCGAPPILRRAGDVVMRAAEDAHRVALVDHQPVWTLFFTGPRRREWGFHCPQGWVHWTDFTRAHDGQPGRIGRGCG